MIKRMCALIIGFFLSFNALANSHLLAIIPDSDELENRWSLIASLGYAEFQHIYRSDGRTVLGRLAFAAELLTISQASLGLEIGVQSSNRMRISIPQSTLGTLGYAVQTTMRPMLDLLVTANANPLSESLLFTQVKGGVAYRHWQLNDPTVTNKSQLAGEVQAGFGYPLTEITSLSLLYQGVFGGNPKFRTHPTFIEAGYVANIPIQHGILLGFSIIA